MENENSVSMELEQVTDIIAFWFGELRENELPDKQKRMLWWAKSEEHDSLIREKFEGYVLSAKKGRISHWLSDPLGTIAFIIVADQFPRNIYRGTSNAFSMDSIALRACLDGIEKEFDKGLHPAYRIFFYLPLMHSENPEMQRLSLQKYLALEDQYSGFAEIKQMLSDSTDFARRHLKIIKKFGRYPHRNFALGRESTPEEIDFLKEPGSSF